MVYVFSYGDHHDLLCALECGGVLESPAGTFSYPTNPGTGDYDHQVSCAWVIRTDPSKVSKVISEPFQNPGYLVLCLWSVFCCSSQILRITFPFFDIENSASCNFDFLQVHDGETASAYMIGKYCGTGAPAELFSSHNSLYFWFRSDHSVSGRGFTVAWQSQAPGKQRMPLKRPYLLQSLDFRIGFHA